MHYRLYILLTGLFVTIYGCSGGESVLEIEQAEVSELLKEKFNSANQLVYGKDTMQWLGSAVISYYKEKDFLPIWTLKDSLTAAGRGNVKSGF
jgi:hypothetical protein